MMLSVMMNFTADKSNSFKELPFFFPIFFFPIGARASTDADGAYF